MWIVLAGSWNLISGLTGYVSFGHVAFYGIGAYAGAILVTTRGLGLGAGRRWREALAACLLAVLIGYPCLRLKGPYFAIAMLGLNEVLRALVSYFEGLTGGGSGLSLPTLDASVADLLRHGARGDAGHAADVPHRHLALRPPPHDDPRGRGGGGGDGHRHRAAQAGRASSCPRPAPGSRGR